MIHVTDNTELKRIADSLELIADITYYDALFKSGVIPLNNYRKCVNAARAKHKIKEGELQK